MDLGKGSLPDYVRPNLESSPSLENPPDRISAIGYRKRVKNKWFLDKLEVVINADTSLGGFSRPEIFWADTFYGELSEIWKDFSTSE